MKKVRNIVFCIIFTVIALLSVETVCKAVDYGATMKLTPSNNTLKVGDNVTVTLSLASTTNVEGVATVHAKIVYDKEVLQFISCEATNLWSAANYNEENQEFVTERSDVMTPTGDIVKFNFKVVAIPDNSVTTVSVTEFDVADTENQITVPDTSTNLTINSDESGEKPDDKPDNNPSENPDDNNQENNTIGDQNNNHQENTTTPEINTDNNNRNNTSTISNNSNDNTIANGKIPQTGANAILPIIIVISIVTIIVIYYRNKKIKDIK